jgi:DNA-binding CsgD family transcriptional regulator/DNA-binding MarR family transcriptional regulator
MTHHSGRDGVLAAVGLGTLEERAYRAVLALGSPATEAVRESLDLTAEQVDDALDRLAAKGLVSRTTGSAPTRLVAAPITIAADALLHARFVELQAARSELAQLAHDYRAAHGANAVEDVGEIVRADAVPALFTQLQRRATREVRLVTIPPYAVAADQNAIEFEQLARGVRYRSLYTHEALEQTGALAEIHRCVLAGEQARALPSAPTKLAIFDQSCAMLPLARDGRAVGPQDSVVVRDCPLLDALAELYERLWLTAVQFGPAVSDAVDGQRRPRPDGMSASEARLLAMLLAGMTDDAIGRQFGVARRTVVRRVHQLMERAKAGNRLQLVLRAAQLGWIDVDRPGTGVRVAIEPTARGSRPALPLAVGTGTAARAPIAPRRATAPQPATRRMCDNGALAASPCLPNC